MKEISKSPKTSNSLEKHAAPVRKGPSPETYRARKPTGRSAWFLRSPRTTRAFNALGNYERVRKPVRQTPSGDQSPNPAAFRATRKKVFTNLVRLKSYSPPETPVNSNRIRNIGCGASLRQGKLGPSIRHPGRSRARVLKKSGRH